MAGDNISIIAKIENRAGIDSIEDICEECDGIMIGRGDMGVEIPFEELPAIQKKLHYKVPVGVANESLLRQKCWNP